MSIHSFFFFGKTANALAKGGPLSALCAVKACSGFPFFLTRVPKDYTGGARERKLIPFKEKSFQYSKTRLKDLTQSSSRDVLWAGSYETMKDFSLWVVSVLVRRESLTLSLVRFLHSRSNEDLYVTMLPSAHSFPSPKNYLWFLDRFGKWWSFETSVGVCIHLRCKNVPWQFVKAR